MNIVTNTDKIVQSLIKKYRKEIKAMDAKSHNLAKARLKFEIVTERVRNYGNDVMEDIDSVYGVSHIDLEP